ncbi:MAG TPA: GNAT family N-acetyltransferase [Bacilli bacterium]|nr:GNAT family N-acetyltransferase [Bacilli bacterium]
MKYIKEHIDNNSRVNGTGKLNTFLKEGLSYEEWLEYSKQCVDKAYAELNNTIPCNTFFTIRESDNKIVGMVNVRHCLIEEISKYAGHIGYDIRPLERGKGYAKIQLYLALQEAKKLGLKKVMITCDQTNVPSERTIRALGGFFEKNGVDETKDSIESINWIDVNKALEDHKAIIEETY